MSLLSSARSKKTISIEMNHVIGFRSYPHLSFPGNIGRKPAEGATVQKGRHIHSRYGAVLAKLIERQQSLWRDGTKTVNSFNQKQSSSYFVQQNDIRKTSRGGQWQSNRRQSLGITHNRSILSITKIQDV